MKTRILSMLFCVCAVFLSCTQMPSEISLVDRFASGGGTVTPAIFNQPRSQSVLTGQSATFSITATGTAPLAYQWKKDGVDISGATTSSLTVSNVQSVNAGTYTVVVTNSAGNATSNGAVLTVNAACAAPIITIQPSAQSATAPATAMFTVPATGTSPTYQWQRANPATPTTFANVMAGTGGTTASYTTAATVVASDSGAMYRCVITNGCGNATSNAVLLTVRTTSGGGTVTDVDGNVYHTVVIGTQEWMVENLKTTKYNDSTAIPNVTDGPTWSALTTPAYCWYTNDAATYKATYGALYNWYTVNTGKLAPTGWHVPTDAEWTTLTTYIGGETVAGGKLKATGTWSSPNTGATNETGFSALPGGCRYPNGTFSLIGDYGNWWSATANDASSSWSRTMYSNGTNVYRANGSNAYGFSVRCVKG